jgi:molybdopterin-guanine dinucleotide biosynthesis protein A
MGTPKAELDWHGVALVVHVACAVQAAVAGPVVVVAAPDQVLPALPGGMSVARDPVAGRGPLQGLAAGLEALDADIAFACATDQPDAWRLAPALFAALEPDDDAVALAGQPLGAVYRTALAAVAQQRLAGDDHSLRGLLAAVRTRVVELDAAPLRSIDTPADYRTALDLE